MCSTVTRAKQVKVCSYDKRKVLKSFSFFYILLFLLFIFRSIKAHNQPQNFYYTTVHYSSALCWLSQRPWRPQRAYISTSSILCMGCSRNQKQNVGFRFKKSTVDLHYQRDHTVPRRSATQRLKQSDLLQITIRSVTHDVF